MIKNIDIKLEAQVKPWVLNRISGFFPHHTIIVKLKLNKNNYT